MGRDRGAVDAEWGSGERDALEEDSVGIDGGGAPRRRQPHVLAPASRLSVEEQEQNLSR